LFQLIWVFFCVIYEVTYLKFYILFCLISKRLMGGLCGHPPPILKSLCYTDYQILMFFLTPSFLKGMSPILSTFTKL